VRGAQDKMPVVLWHNVLMSAAAANPVSPRPFSFDWKAVEQGVPLSALEGFATYSGLSMKDLLEVVIPLRTLKHRRQRQEPLNLDESDRLARVARLYELGVRVFGDSDRARIWLSTPKHRFEEHSPLSMMRTELGGRLVEEMLIQIDEGYFA
jgi:putative toxin-antitoxin system antitoxin component (TIGR02293 family)